MTNTIPNVPRYRVEKTGRGFWPYCVRAGDGTREVFVGHQKQCAVVAAELETAFEDGKFVSGIAPSPAGVDGWDVAGDILEKLSAAQLEIDQQAQRIGELEGLLRACHSALYPFDNNVLEREIDAALPAGKDSVS